MSTASQGRAREYAVRDDLTAEGWTPIMRAAASKGAGDLLLGHPEHGAALVQVGTTSKSLNPKERSRFLHAAWLISALPIIATVHRGHVTYRVVRDGPPLTWTPFNPST